MHATTERILQALKQVDGFVSGQELSGRLGVSRVTVSKHIRRLRAQGYRVESLPHKGHRLERLTDLPLAAEVTPLLQTRRVGQSYAFLESVDSTNSALARMPRSDVRDGMVLVADHQTGGRGRMGRVWHSPPGCGLYFSVLVQPEAAPAELPQLALVAGIAVCTALRGACPELEFGIKWPNDVLVGRRKVAGILCEMEAEADAVHHVILGMGVNVNTAADVFPRELRPIATSLRKESGRSFNRAELLARILNQLDGDYDAWQHGGLGPLLPRLQEASVLTGLTVTVEGPRERIRGVVRGINAEGCLELQLSNRTLRSVPSGEVHVKWKATR